MERSGNTAMLKNKVAIVTGSTSGIGQQSALKTLCQSDRTDHAEQPRV
jgi:NAD(P)-dependent dehydrogenase (short-subunit alcohol dehydrogenase family)